MRSILLTLVLALSLLQVSAQQIAIGTGDITDCGAFIVDSGYSAADYSDSEERTTTICSDGSEASNLINLYFTVFQLGTGDTFYIYDGQDTSAPLIGTYTTSDLQGLDVTATNGTGCLTVRFTSDGDGDGDERNVPVPA